MFIRIHLKTKKNLQEIEKKSLLKKYYEVVVHCQKIIEKRDIFNQKF